MHSVFCVRLLRLSEMLLVGVQLVMCVFLCLARKRAPAKDLVSETQKHTHDGGTAAASGSASAEGQWRLVLGGRGAK